MAECTVLPFRYFTTLIWCISTLECVPHIIQEVPYSLTVLVILQFREFKGFICLEFGKVARVSSSVGLKSLFRGARSRLGIPL